MTTNGSTKTKIAYIRCPSCGYVHNVPERSGRPQYVPTGCPQENRWNRAHRYTFMEMTNIFNQLVKAWDVALVQAAVQRHESTGLLPGWAR